MWIRIIPIHFPTSALLSALSVLDICCANKIICPSPVDAATISAPMIALHAYPRLVRIPIKMSGIAHGRITRRNRRPFPYENALPTSSNLGSAPVNPFTILRYMGKKEARTIITVFVVSPIPHQRIRSGIIEIGGTFRKNCTEKLYQGSNAGRNTRNAAKTNAKIKAIPNPFMTRSRLIPISLAISPFFSIFINVFATFSGEGST